MPLNMTHLFSFADAANTASGAFLGLGITGLIIALLLSLFTLWMFIDALTNPVLNSTMKAVWAVIIFFGPVLGAVAYFFIGRRPRGSAPSV
jgi:hypothetical protein